MEKLLDWENSHLYNKLGLKWKLARQRCDSTLMMEYVLLVEFIPKQQIYKPDWIYISLHLKHTELNKSSKNAANVNLHKEESRMIKIPDLVAFKITSKISQILNFTNNIHIEVRLSVIGYKIS